MNKLELIKELDMCTTFEDILELDEYLTSYDIYVDDCIDFMYKEDLDEWSKGVICLHGIEVLQGHIKDIDLTSEYYTFDAYGWLKPITNEDIEYFIYDLKVMLEEMDE